MGGFNKVILLARLTRDPQLKFLSNQTAVCEFGVATNRKFRTAAGEDREEVTFIDLVSFGKTGETINQYFRKGDPIFVEGNLKYDSWEDKQGGGKRHKLSVNVQSFQFVGGSKGGNGSASGSGGSAGGRQDAEPAQVGEGIAEDDIPFAWGGRDTTPI